MFPWRQKEKGQYWNQIAIGLINFELYPSRLGGVRRVEEEQEIGSTQILLNRLLHIGTGKNACLMVKFVAGFISPYFVAMTCEEGFELLGQQCTIGRAIGDKDQLIPTAKS